MQEVITVGEPMVVWIPLETGSFTKVERFSKGVAGAELNVAIGVTRLGHEVSYISRLGTDIYGTYLREKMKEEQISLQNIISDEENLTGSYFKSKVQSGDPEVHYLRKNSAASFLSPKDLEKLSFQGGKILHLTGIAAAISPSCLKACGKAIEKAREEKLLVFFDPNIRKSLWKTEAEMVQTLNELAFQSDMVMPGIKEGRLLSQKEAPEEIADFYLEKGVQTVIVKLGSKGAFYKTHEGKEGYVPGFSIKEIVDTVGAGDAFAAGVITGILEGLSLEKAVLRGNAMGALMVTSIGDNEAMPVREVLMSFMKGEG